MTAVSVVLVMDEREGRSLKRYLDLSLAILGPMFGEPEPLVEVQRKLHATVVDEPCFALLHSDAVALDAAMEAVVASEDSRFVRRTWDAMTYDAIITREA